MAAGNDAPSQTGHRHRDRGLDGLRGLAALIVVLYHSLLASSTSLADSVGPVVPHYRVGSLKWLLVRTPLHIFWAGGEMVIVFFVLSGYVLALPAARLGRRWLDGSYYPRRLVRLFLPAWAALVLGGLLHETHLSPLPGGTFFLNEHTVGLTLTDGLRGATLVYPGQVFAYDPVLWSLGAEVTFSLVLPVVIVLALAAWRRAGTALLAAVACLVGAWLLAKSFHSSTSPLLVYDLQYLPVFILGSLLALSPRLPRPRQSWFALAMVAAVCLLTSSYVGTGHGIQTVVNPTYCLDVAGAVLTVWVALVFDRARAVLETRPIQWLGRRSFSLYLVHEPIVIAVAFLCKYSPATELLVAVPLSLIAAEIFWRLVESPSVRLAARVGDAVRRDVVTSPSPALR